MLGTIYVLTAIWTLVALGLSAPVRDEQGKVKIIYHVGDIVEHAYTNDAWNLQQTPPVNRLQNANTPDQQVSSAQTNSNSKSTDESSHPAHPNTNSPSQNRAHPHTNSPGQNLAHPNTNSPDQNFAHPNTNAPGQNLAHPNANSNSNLAHPNTNAPNPNSNFARPSINPTDPGGNSPNVNANSNDNSQNRNSNSPISNIPAPNSNRNAENDNIPNPPNTNPPFNHNIPLIPPNANVNLFPGNFAHSNNPQHPSRFPNTNPSLENENKPHVKTETQSQISSFVPNTFHSRGDGSAPGGETGFPPFFHNSNNNLNHHNTHFNIQQHRGSAEASDNSSNQAPAAPRSPSTTTTTTTTTTSTTTKPKPSTTTTIPVPSSAQQMALPPEVPLQRHVPHLVQQPPFAPESSQKSLESFLAMLEETKAPGGVAVDDQRPSASVVVPSTSVQQLPTPEALIQQSPGTTGQQTAPKDWAVYDDPQTNQTAVVTQDHKYGYIVHGNNFKRFRVEEKTGNGVVHGLFGVHHNNGNFRGVQYQADSGEVHPKIIYDTLVKFLSL